MKKENWDDVKEGECEKQETVYRRDNNGETKKTISTKKKIENGKVKETKTEEYAYPDGTKRIIQSVNNDGRIETRSWDLLKGQERPKELTNWIQWFIDWPYDFEILGYLKFYDIQSLKIIEEKG